MKYSPRTAVIVALALVNGGACNDDTGTGADASDTSGDGDGEPGDGDPGDGDGDPGDGDPGDGDGDPGDGDGDPGDGDGDPGDGDGDGDPGDGDPGDGDGDPGDGDGDPGDGDGDVEPLDDTIVEVRDGTLALGSDVDVDGVWVTALGELGFYAQEPAGGPYSGVWVHAGAMGPDLSGLAIGDLIDLTGVTAEVDGVTRIDVSAGVVEEVGALAPTPNADLVTTAELDADAGEPWESVLVRVINNPIVVTALLGAGEFTIDDGVATATVDDLLYDAVAAAELANFAAGATFTGVTGPVHFEADSYRIAPRFVADLEGYAEPDQGSLGVDELDPGQLVITEIMYDPDVCMDNFCEWIEVYNAADAPVDLGGLRVQDALQNQTGVVFGPVIVPAGGYAWIGRGPLADWDYTGLADGFYGSSPSFNNNTDRVVILNAEGILDESYNYSDNGNPSGVSLQLDPGSIDAVANDSPSNWCPSTTDFGDGDLGTPGAPNLPCN